MNKQKDGLDIDRYVAIEQLRTKFPEESGYLLADYLDYWAYPQVFGSTSGPFGGIGGQAMTTFTIEAWVCDNLAVLFCKSRIIKVTNEWKGPQSVRV